MSHGREMGTTFVSTTPTEASLSAPPLSCAYFILACTVWVGFSLYTYRTTLVGHPLMIVI